MKTHCCSSRNALILMTACLLFLGPYATSQAMNSGAQSRRADAAETAGRLIVNRDPALGNFLIAHLRVDGVPVAAIAYGRTYEGFLSPGRHVLSLLPTPSPKWLTPSAMILDVRSGQTYTFTAIGDSGYLILLPPEVAQARPRGR
ncbi:MAG TPA: hypothetical protein VGI41_01825 [Candidatus Udaeobacter sp.]